VNVLERNVLVRPVAAQTARGLRRQPQQRANRRTRLAARAQLQHLPELHEHHDHRSRLEVDAHAAVVHAQGGGKDARDERGHNAVDPRHADAERDQREHVGAAVDDRLPAAHEERRTAPQHDRGGQQELEPRQPLRHRQPHDHRGQHGAHAKAPRHVGELFVLGLFGGHLDRLERHAADGARPRPDLPHLGVHRAGVFEAFGLRPWALGS
jgi:hypothetical protein